mmetsp:Transcript_25170/g.54247  ORF Transcript_25170/g.54247 Transcript_25170/m.54247 type:complete len:416 (+) Transcript_25170:152-1399(+)|eukprot:CAMPEP_0172298150 /NCGR_PEP_ID=MMETSP1058-20130122/923_1 /TAXON_ID=83371 /ORGANISM="Detonula confervacea, Strain CCMP 353" /LENGTH=415 /DNA_ID=CAMNT_0013007395 /DNA_START=147 /DNA_END=1394 /DNA_ORIENTATION=-
MAEAKSYQLVENYEKKSGETKNIIVCFDGTGGAPEWAVQDEGEVPLYESRGGLSNVCKLHLLAGGNIDNSNSTEAGQLPLYYKGVGTWHEDMSLMQGFKSAFGMGAMHEIYIKAYADLEKIHQEGDQIFIFGFSRGAATARLFASYLDHNNINGVVPQIALLGVFDTVVQSSDVGNNEDIKNLDIKGKDSSLPKSVKKAIHLVSLDEMREPFKPTLFNEDDRVTEVWCPGNHSDVGGGYYHDGLSDVTLECMLFEAIKSGMKHRELTPELCSGENSFSLIGNKLTMTSFANFDRDMSINKDMKINALDPDVHDECGAPFKLNNILKNFHGRKVRVMKDDKEVKGKDVLVLHSTITRINEWEEKIPYMFQAGPYLKYSFGKSRYSPRNLKNVPIKIVAFDKGKGIHEHPNQSRPKL